MEQEYYLYIYTLSNGLNCVTTNRDFAVRRSQQEGTDIVLAEPIN
jgi:hypothetical protein